MSKAVVVICAIVYLGVTLANVAHPRNELKNREGVIEDLINATLERLRANLTDPIVIGDLNLNLTSNLTTGWLNITNGTLHGLNTFNATYIQLHDITGLNITLEVPELVLDLGYAVDLLIADIVPIFGSGPINVTIGGASVNITTTADISLIPPGINGVNGTRVILNVETASFAVNGLFNDPAFDELINTLLNDTIVNFINTHTQAIANISSPIVEELINAILANL